MIYTAVMSKTVALEGILESICEVVYVVVRMIYTIREEEKPSE